MLKHILEQNNILSVFLVFLLLETIPTSTTQQSSYLLKQEGESSGDGARKEASPG